MNLTSIYIILLLIGILSILLYLRIKNKKVKLISTFILIITIITTCILSYRPLFDNICKNPPLVVAIFNDLNTMYNLSDVSNKLVKNPIVFIVAMVVAIPAIATPINFIVEYPSFSLKFTSVISNFIISSPLAISWVYVLTSFWSVFIINIVLFFFAEYYSGLINGMGKSVFYTIVI